MVSSPDKTQGDTLTQKKADGLRQEYRLLIKGSYAKEMTPEQRSSRRTEIEQLFARSGLSLRDS